MTLWGAPPSSSAYAQSPVATITEASATAHSKYLFPKVFMSALLFRVRCIGKSDGALEPLFRPCPRTSRALYACLLRRKWRRKSVTAEAKKHIPDRSKGQIGVLTLRAIRAG